MSIQSHNDGVNLFIGTVNGLLIELDVILLCLVILKLWAVTR